MKKFSSPGIPFVWRFADSRSSPSLFLDEGRERERGRHTRGYVGYSWLRNLRRKSGHVRRSSNFRFRGCRVAAKQFRPAPPCISDPPIGEVHKLVTYCVTMRHVVVRVVCYDSSLAVSRTRIPFTFFLSA